MGKSAERPSYLPSARTTTVSAQHSYTRHNHGARHKRRKNFYGPGFACVLLNACECAKGCLLFILQFDSGRNTPIHLLALPAARPLATLSRDY